ncbi:Uncharacterized protein HZ326_6867 [Fusarium oxysporum f. sp. albedinis]|nr:Uncharacterized protein HZ326_6867 [Fusarium oxysporum f. sp. albedinis]
MCVCARDRSSTSDVAEHILRQRSSERFGRERKPAIQGSQDPLKWATHACTVSPSWCPAIWSQYSTESDGFYTASVTGI